MELQRSILQNEGEDMNVKGDNNRSVRETRAKIQSVFLDLMKKKPYHKISIREIAEAANINRSTFYLHYEDIYDLLDKIEDEINDELADAVRQIKREGYVQGKHPQHTEVFRVLNKNADKARILMSENGKNGFFNRTVETVKQTMLFGWRKANGGVAPEKADLYATYVAYAVVGVFRRNLNVEEPYTAEELGHFAGEVTEWIDETFCRDRATSGT